MIFNPFWLYRLRMWLLTLLGIAVIVGLVLLMLQFLSGHPTH